MSSAFIDEDNVSNSFNFVLDDDEEEISSDRKKLDEDALQDWTQRP